MRIYQPQCHLLAGGHKTQRIQLLGVLAVEGQVELRHFDARQDLGNDVIGVIDVLPCRDDGVAAADKYGYVHVCGHVVDAGIGECDKHFLQRHYVYTAHKQILGVCIGGYASEYGVVKLKAAASHIVEVSNGVAVGIGDIGQQLLGVGV